MAPVYKNIGHIALMLMLLVGSAFFSGTETAFFNLSRRQIKLFQKSKHKLQNLTAKILTKPNQLLSCLLFGNMMVNTFFFAVASVLTVRVERQAGLTVAAITAVLTFCMLVLFGEILPKSLAYASSKPVCITTALPVFLCLKVFTPVVSIFRFLIVEPAIRLMLGPAPLPKAITSGEFKALIEATRQQGLISTDENKLLTEIIELGFLKVRHVMRPRVDIITCEVTDSPETARRIMLKNHLTKLPVYAGEVDNIVGLVYLRHLLLQPNTSLDKLLQKVHFVPEQKTVESLLEFFRKAHIDIAIVVDEYGGIAGSVYLEDIAEELLGPIEFTGAIEPIEQISPFQFRLAGNLTIHDWAQTFGFDMAETRLSTIGGLVTALLGKIPKTGDVAHLKDLKFTVERMRKNRIETLILTLEMVPTDAQ